MVWFRKFEYSYLFFNVTVVSTDDLLDPGGEGLAGLHHQLPQQQAELLHDRLRDRFHVCMKPIAGPGLQDAPHKIVEGYSGGGSKFGETVVGKPFKFLHPPSPP